MPKLSPNVVREGALPRRVMAAPIRVGTSGWRYAAWRGSFYPKELPQRAELSFLAQRVDSVEINGSFYRLQRPENYERWFEATPEDFCFAVKAPRYITHSLRLRGTELAMANFLASGVLCLEHKLGPLLWQLPATLHFEPLVLSSFLEQLPRDTREAAALASRHDGRVQSAGGLRNTLTRRVRHALEVRSPTFADEACVALLRKFEVALVVADSAGRFPYLTDLTSDFVYVRLHGAEELYVSGYGPGVLDIWAQRVQQWAAGGQPADAVLIDRRHAAPQQAREVYVYFDNDAKVHAPFDAMALRRRLTQTLAPALSQR